LDRHGQGCPGRQIPTDTDEDGNQAIVQVGAAYPIVVHHIFEKLVERPLHE